MKYADYIKEIEIDALWGGSSELCSPEHQRSVRKHVKWTLDPHVNILSGVNGDGKSTILRRAITGARAVNAYEDNGIRVKTEPADAEYVRYNWISTPDVRSEYDDNLQEFVKRYNEQTPSRSNLLACQSKNSPQGGGFPERVDLLLVVFYYKGNRRVHLALLVGAFCAPSEYGDSLVFSTYNDKAATSVAHVEDIEFFAFEGCLYLVSNTERLSLTSLPRLDKLLGYFSCFVFAYWCSYAKAQCKYH